MSLDDDDENGSVDSGSENDVDETMEDVDAEDDNGDADADGDEDGDGDGDGDVDGDGDGENDEDGDNDDEDGENEDEDDQGDMESPSQPNRHLPNGISQQSTAGESSNPTLLLTSPSPRPNSSFPSVLPLRPNVRPEALTATYYDIVPTIAAPHSTSINTVTATPDMRWVFSGGSDGYIRKFSWPDTVNGKLMLTVAQRHPFVDSVMKAGVILSYWENEEPSDRVQTTPRQGDDSMNLSPVYSLAVHNQGLWLLSGLESGGINLQSVRHEEGKKICTLRGHTNAVSVLTLSEDERSVLSGSWDKTINDWDLNTGQIKRKFATSGGQIAAIEPRPLSTLPVPQEYGTRVQTNGTFSSNNVAKPSTNGVLPNGVPSSAPGNSTSTEQNGANPPGSPEDSQASLFGDNGDSESLFGDSGQGPSGGGMPGLDDDDEFSRAIANELQHQQQDENIHGDVDMIDAGGPVQPPQPLDQPVPVVDVPTESNTTLFSIGESHDGNDTQSSVLVNGLPHSEEDPTHGGLNGSNTENSAPPTSDTTFLDASIDGTLRVWDRRQPNPIARIVPHRSAPPWCMNACWSPDGNQIYAGRRNGTVDEYNLHKGLKEPKRSFKFPPVSGAISAVKAMPNGRHLICASHDILRLYDLKEELGRHQATPFYIVPGHRTGVISQLYIDPTCRFMITTGGNRGWEGYSTEVLLGYEIGIE